MAARPGHSEHRTGLVMDVGNVRGVSSKQSCRAHTPLGQTSEDTGPSLRTSDAAP